jgi:sugar lactone lactonase YvrE
MLNLRSQAQPVILVQPTNQVVLNSSNATLSVGASGVGWLSYQWRFNETNLPKYMITVAAGGGNGSDGGAATSAALNYPSGVTGDAAGNIYIVEGGGNSIRKVDTNGIISTVAGNGYAGYSGDGGPATNASLNFPLQVVVARSGNLYFTDNINNRVREVDTNGVITTVAGNGVAGYSGDGGQAKNASLNLPTGLALDGGGNLYFTDYFNNRVRKVDVNGIISSVAGNGSGAFSGDGGLATDASLDLPNSLAFDAAGNLYIADYGNNRLRKVDLNGIISTVVGNGQLYAGGDGGAATNASIVDVCAAFDALGNILVADSYANDVRQIDTNGIITNLVTGFNQPSSLFVDSADNLYVADSQNNRIGKVALLGTPVLNLNQVTPANAGNYDVVISDAGGSVTSSVVSLTVNVPAFISTPPMNHSVSVGSNATFTVTAGGTLPLHYQWLSNNIVMLDATNSSISFNVASTNLVGGFSVVVTNDFGSVTSSIAMLAVLVIPPAIVSQPASQTVPLGSDAMLNVVASGSPPFGYQWSYNGTVMDAQTNYILSLSGVTTNQAGAYSVVLSSPYGSITSLVATLTVAVPPTFTRQPTNQSVLAGGQVVIDAGVSGVGPLTFQWQFDGTNLPNNLITTLAGNGSSGYSGDNGLAVTGKISYPYGMAVDKVGNLFFADSSNNRIRKVDTKGVMTTVAGSGLSGFSGDGGAATNARLSGCLGVARDGQDDLLIADTSNNRIRKVDTNGIITTVAGGGLGGDGGAATNAGLNNPAGVVVDTNGNIFIDDWFNNRIRKVDSNGIITTVAGRATSGFSGDGGAATNASLKQPQGLALGRNGDLFIADYGNNRVRKVAANGVITTIAGTGFSLASGDNSAATNAGVNPYAVAVDDYGDVLIADGGNNRIRQVDPYGIITTIAGTNSSGYNGDGVPATSALLNSPRGLTLDNYGRIIIADTDHSRIRRFGQGPALLLDNVAATNAGDYTLVINSSFGSVTSSVATLTVLLPPTIVSQPANQSVGLGNNAVFHVTVFGTDPLSFVWQTNGVIQSSQTNQDLSLTNVQWSDAGTYQVVITNDYGSVTSVLATLTVGLPPAIISPPTNEIAAVGDDRLLSVVVTGDGLFTYQWQFNGADLPPIITTVAGTNVASYSGDDGAATTAGLNQPQAIAFDGVGGMYIADYGDNRVRKVDSVGIITTIAGTGAQGNTGDGGPAVNATLNHPSGVTFDSTGNLFIAESGSGDVRKIDTNGVITRVAGTGTLGSSVDGGQATNTPLNTVTGVTFDRMGNMYLNETVYNRVRKVATNGIITTVAGKGTAGFSGDGGAATNAQLRTPHAITFDSVGNLFIADYGNDRVRKVDTNGIITTIAGIGSTFFNGDNQPATNAALLPNGLAVDSEGNLLISDSRRIRRVDANGIITTVAGKGILGFDGDGGAATNASMKSNSGIALDQVGNLFIADTGNNRIREAHLAGDPTLLLANLGTTNSGNYGVVVTSPFGSVTGSVASLSVLPRPTLQSLNPGNGRFDITWDAVSNLTYQLQYATNLVGPGWVDLGNPITSTNGSAMTTVDYGPEQQRFYRVRVVP